MFTTKSHNGNLLRRVLIVGAVVVLIALPFMLPPYSVLQLGRVLALSLAILGLILLTGYSGQISLGQSFFFAAGAYTAGVLIRDFEIHYLLTLPAALIVSFVLGLLFGLPAARLRGLYLALVTLALAMVTPNLIRHFSGVTGGSQGLQMPRIEAPDWMGLASDQWVYYTALAVVGLSFWIARNLIDGKVGRTLLAVRDNELVARSMGVNIARYRVLIFACSSGFAGLGGALFAMLVGYLAPESFNLHLSLSLIAGAVVGGITSIVGALFGSVFAVYIPIVASEIHDALGGVIHGLALILVVHLLPGGVAGLAQKIPGLRTKQAPQIGDFPPDGEPDEPELAHASIATKNNNGGSTHV